MVAIAGVLYFKLTYNKAFENQKEHIDPLEEKNINDILEENKISKIILKKLKNSYFGLEIEELNIEFYKKNIILNTITKLENESKIEIKYGKYYR